MRAAIVELLVSIGGVAVEECEEEYADLVDFAGAAMVVRERAEMFVAFAADADHRVRQAAIPGLGLFLDDADRAGEVLRHRLSAEAGLVERLLIVEAMGTLALRLPASADEAMAWFAGLAADSTLDPGSRLAAVVQQARCAPEQIGEDVVPTAIGLLRQMAHGAAAYPALRNSPGQATSAGSAGGVPPQVVAAFEDLDRQGRVHAPTTELLRTFHEALATRVSQRTALLTEQLASPDPGSRLDAIRMSQELMTSWRGDHTWLITLVAGQLCTSEHEVAAEAAAVLETCHPIAESAREPLAAYVAAYGPDMWTAPQQQLRRAYQNAIRALARLSDVRAVPGLLAALDCGVDDWRAVAVVGALKEASQELVPRLCDHVRRMDHAQQRLEMSAGSLLSALAALGDQAALPAITDTLVTAVRHEQWSTTCSALKALAAFGPAAAPALPAIRSLTAAADAYVRHAAVGALWAVSGDQEEVTPLLHDLLGSSVSSWKTLAADVLGEIGPPVTAALPRLRKLLTDNYEWVRVHGATALWEVGGAAEARVVLDTLLQAWEQNPATANHVAACLDRMGPAAAPALPRLRSKLIRPRLGGRFASIDNDEELQRTSRAIVERLA
ncbi:HEAT repeat protein [Nonomuraea jabiensis]|uniref:HEAT repeat protein n=1 Tax=Nonomuraea jabiensis TaxID=882448 RepID=A0A7W9FY60_9ACTN|nr:HEAT repeat protein [Nonomuraea jabiensis]